MGKEVYRLIPEEQEIREVIEYKLKHGLITRDDLDRMSPQERDLVKDVLFDMYAKNINSYISLSTLEFCLMYLAKLFFKRDAGEPLDEKEQEFYNQFKSLVESHEAVLDVTDWRFNYLKSTTEKVIQNRQEYKNKKSEIIG